MTKLTQSIFKCGIIAALFIILTGQILANENPEDKYNIPLPTQLNPSYSQIGLNHFDDQDAMKAFTKVNGDWSGFLNQTTGTIHRAFGKLIQINGFSNIDKSNIENASITFLNQHKDILKVNTDEIRLKRANFINGKWYVSFVQVFKGLDVLLSEIELRITPTGKVMAFGADFYKNINISPIATISNSQAIEFASNGMDIDKSKDMIQSTGKKYILPYYKNGILQYKLVYSTEVRTIEPAGRYMTFVDAHSGDVLWRQNMILNAQSSINSKASIKEHNPLDNETFANLQNLNVWVGSEQYQTDLNGEINVDITLDTQIRANLEGPWAKVEIQGQSVNKNNFIGTIKPGENISIIWDNSNSNLHERNMFYHTNKVRSYIKNIDPDFNGMDYQVNIVLSYDGQYSNAYWDGESITFLSLGYDAVRMANGPMVLYHEYTHGINEKLYQSQGSEFGMINAACNEGTADLNPSLILDVPEMGLGVFAEDDKRYIRTLKNTLIYPDSLQNESHHDGQILGGAFWDLREMTSLEYVAKLSHFAKYGLPDDTDISIAFSEWFIETLIADDDDGDLTNGTPNSDKIIIAFNNHNIGTDLYIKSTFSHTPLEDTQNTTEPYVAEFTLSGSGLPGHVPENILLVYKANNQDMTQSVEAEHIGGNKYRALIPPQPKGTIINYHFSATDNISKQTFNLTNDNLKYKPFQFLIGYTRRYQDKFESESNGWYVGDPSDNITQGKWEWGRPSLIDFTPMGIALILQPGDDYSEEGMYCFVTGKGGNINNYSKNIPDGKTSLISATYDMTKLTSPVIRFYHWFFNMSQTNIPQFDGRFRIFASYDNGNTWELVEMKTEATDGWERYQFLLEDFVLRSNEVKFKIEISVAKAGNYPLSLTECLIDDFEIWSTGIDDNVTSAEDDYASASIIFPNPFHKDLNINYNSSSDRRIKIELVDLFGSVIDELYNGSVTKGNNHIKWNNSVSLNSSGYFVRISSINGIEHYPVTFIK